VALDDMEQFSTRMRRMCREERVEFFDIRKAGEDYMLRSYKPYDHFARDAIHGNSRGKQIVGRILTRYFEPKDASRLAGHGLLGTQYRAAKTPPGCI
jgi:hypothetical protein